MPGTNINNFSSYVIFHAGNRYSPDNFSSRANRKVSAFAKVAKYIDFQKAKLLYQSLEDVLRKNSE